MTLLGVDFIVFGSYLVAVVALGCFFYRKSRTSNEFMVAGGALPGWAIGLSLFGTYLSSNTFIGVTGRAFGHDWSFFVFSLTLPVAAWIGVRFFVPFYRNAGEISAYHHMEARFGGWARSFCAALYLFTQIARMATIMFGVALALHVLTGWNLVTIIIIAGASVTLYTVIGGVAAVIWTDVAQSILLTAGAVIILFLLLFTIQADPMEAIAAATEEGKFSLGSWDLSLTSATVTVIFLYALFMNTGNYAFDQNYVQRFHTARSNREAKKAVWLGALLYVPVSALFFFLGTLLYSYYQADPELYHDLKMQVAMTTASLDVSPESNLSEADAVAELAASYTSADVGDRAFPHFLANRLPAGFAGLLLAAIAAAAMSSIDSSLNSSATIIMRDFYKRYVNPEADEKKSMRVLHGATLVWGAVATGAALAMIGVQSILAAWWQLSGIFFGGMFGLFLLGFIVRRADKTSAATGFCAGLCLLLWLIVSPNLEVLPNALRSSFHTYMSVVFTTLCIFLIGLIVSHRPRRSNVEDTHERRT